MGNAILEYRPQRRAARLLFVERTIRRFSPATLPAEPYSSGRYRQHKACRNKNQAKNARGQSCPPAQISIALLPLPAVSFVGGFQTPAGPEKTRAHPSGRHLKPITFADHRVAQEHVSCRRSCGSQNIRRGKRQNDYGWGLGNEPGPIEDNVLVPDSDEILPEPSAHGKLEAGTGEHEEKKGPGGFLFLGLGLSFRGQRVLVR